jgi:myo-inositol 2-dehydrogenase / D-chiro-inositol 1-dehydrogenase
MKKINVGIIGMGRIGKVHTSNIIRYLPNMFVKAVTDPYLDEQWVSDMNVPVSGKDHRIIMDDAEIDAVIICAPSPLHVPLIIEAAEKGKHIFCEKPIALEVPLIKKALEACKKTGVKLQIGFNRRFDPNFAKVKQSIDEGQIGSPHFIQIISRDPAPPPIEYIKQSGGLFLDMTIHDFDMARFLIGSEIEEVYASGAVLVDKEIGEEGDIDTSLISLKFSNGVLGTIQNCRRSVYGYDQRIEVFGSNGCLNANNKTPTDVVLSTDKNVIADKPLYFFLERYQESFVSEMRAFYSSIVNDEATLVSGEEGLMPVVIGLAAKQSLLENRPIKVERNYG